MMWLTRAESGHEDPTPHGLPTQQRRVLEAIDQYQNATGEACSASYLARRLRVHHSTIQKHLFVLHRKGWLLAPNAPTFLSRPLN